MSSIPDRLTAALEGRYTIERELGQGGMATVYLADDVKHERKVAIKVLRPELAAVVGADRFLAEIRTTAKLQHPHILPLHDSGEADGFLFYVMPYVGGESLREKLDREKQLRVDEAIDYARKVGDALDYAHDKGVVHRDIKPANILLSERGEPLVADFGIALAVSQAGEGRITETGLSLGTPHYMSPEQATGDRDVDPRSDVYALGCVLYEMLAGQPPFAAPTAQAVLARILTETPRRVTEMRRTVPPNVASVIAKSLEKLPADRFASVREMTDALNREDFTYTSESPAAGGSRTGRSDTVSPRPSGLVVGLGAALAVAILVAAVGWLGRSGAPGETGGAVTRATVALPDDFVWTGSSAVRISPNDSHLVALDSTAIWIRALGDAEFRRLPNTGEVTDVRFSLDGRELVAVDGDEIVRLNLDGSNRRVVAIEEEEASHAPAWADDGFGYFIRSIGTTQEIVRVPMSGTDSVEVVARSPGAPTIYTSVEPLPGSEALLTTVITFGDDIKRTVLVDVATGASTPLLADGGEARWIRTGHLLFVDSRGDIRITPFDPRTRETSGQMVQLDRGVSLGDPYVPRISVSRRGTLVYSEGASFSLTALIAGGARLLEITLEGDTTLLHEEPFVFGPRWSPDGTKVAFSSGPTFLEAGTSILDRELATRPREIATDVEFAIGFSWSPGGDSLVIVGGDDFSSATTRIADVSGIRSLPVDAPPSASPPALPSDWSGDGLLWVVTGVGPDRDGIWRDADLSEPWLAGAIAIAAVSPDGDHVLYETVDGELIVRSFPEIAPPVVIAEGIPGEIRWAPDGQAIWYTGGSPENPELRRVALTREPTLAPLEDEFVLRLGLNNGWDLHPEGDRVVIAAQSPDTSGQTSTPNEAAITPERTWIVVNWFERVRAAFAGEGR